MKAKYLVAVTLVLLLVLGSVACNRARNDAQITTEVQSKIFADKTIQSRQISVQSSNGVVTLSGSVGNDAERAAVANDAAQVEGVKTVVNNLEAAAPVVAAAQPQEQTPAQPAPAKPAAFEPRQSARSHSASAHKSRSYDYDSESSRMDPPAPTPAPTPAVAMAPATPPPPPTPVKVTIPDGTTISVRMIDSVDTETAQPGQVFKASLDSPIVIDDNVVVPAQADIDGRVVDAKSAGRMAGKSELAVELFKLSYNGRTYSIHTNQYTHAGTSRTATTAKRVGAGAAIGAIIGGIAGGGKGAAIGAAAGGGLGGGATAAGKGQQVRLASEQVLTFTLQSPLTVTPAANVNRNENRHQLSAE